MLSLFHFEATCKCPQTIFLNWYESKPYVIKTGRSSIEGIFYEVLADTLTQSCGICNGKTSVISPYKSLSGEKPEKTSAKKVMSAIGKEYHVSFPVFGKSDMSTYLKQNVFVALVESPGVAVAVRNDVDYTVKTKAAFSAMLNVWPMYIVLIIMTLLAGIFVWFFVSLTYSLPVSLSSIYCIIALKKSHTKLKSLNH